MAEIAPGQYNLIDGNHRTGKAGSMGIVTLKVYNINVERHTQFLTDKKAYVSYVEYWNDKLS